jgi:NADP-dependent 3-hydroxy acid dehydrogenase YdfG
MGPVMVVTGAPSGIGAAIARAASEAGYRLALAARRSVPLGRLARELARRSGPGRCRAT